MHLRPLGLLLLDGGLEEMVRGLWGLSGELVGPPALRDKAEVVGYFYDDACLFPGFAFGGVLGGGLVRLPATFGEDPAAAARRLDEEDVVFVGRKRDNASDEPFALRAVP